ncbi:MAG: ATP-binding protein [Actinomycetota bacterium]
MAALLPLALFSVLMLAVFNQQQRDSLEAIMREAGNSASNAVDAQVGATVAVLSALAASAEFQSEDWPAFGERVRGVVAGAGWLNLAVTDGTRQIYNLGGADRVVDRVGMAEALSSGRPAVSNLIPAGPNNAEPAVVVRIPVLRAGHPPRTLAAFLPSRGFTRLLHEHVPEKWITALADRNGTILARSHAAEIFVGTPLAPTVFAAWQRARPVVFDAVTKEGISSYGLVMRAGTAGWSLAMGAPREVVDGPYRLARHGLWLGGAIAALLTLLLTATVLGVVERGRAAERARTAAEAERRMGERVADISHRLSFALESARAATWDWDAASGRLVWSREFPGLCGLPDDTEPSHRAWLRLLDARHRARAMAYIREIVRGGADEFRLEFPAGNGRWLVAAGRPARAPDGTLVRVSGIIIDITQRKAIEAELETAVREADRANQAKSRFLAAASHDIRQPIQSLMLFAHALEAKLRGHPAAPLVGKVSTALGALKQLLDSILDISKLDAGLVKAERSGFAVAALMRKLVDEYQPRMAAKGLDLHVVPCSAWIDSDPTLLGRIVGNLLENALKYTEAGTVLLGCRHRGDRIAICVGDTGVGIAPEYRDAVFEEFVQIGSQGRDRAQGMGLGLATVKRMAALLGHPIGLVSRPGRGSLFWVEVGRIAPAAGRAGSAEAERAQVAGHHVLVVDDEAAILEGMRVILEAAGHRVETAVSADEAVARVDGGFAPDVVVTDYRLPSGRNGAEVICRVREACRRPVPCIVLTGDTAIVAAGLPSTTLMHKPVDPDALQRAIGRLSARAA